MYTPIVINPLKQHGWFQCEVVVRNDDTGAVVFRQGFRFPLPVDKVAARAAIEDAIRAWAVAENDAHRPLVVTALASIPVRYFMLNEAKLIEDLRSGQTVAGAQLGVNPNPYRAQDFNPITRFDDPAP